MQTSCWQLKKEDISNVSLTPVQKQQLKMQNIVKLQMDTTICFGNNTQFRSQKGYYII